MRKLLFSLVLWLAFQGQPTGTNFLPVMTGTTGSIGGGALLVGACASGTATVTGANAGMVVVATPNDGTNIAAVGTVITATVTSANTVTVNVCALIAVTPASKTYNVRVIP